ncbi:hypothetical protein PybrP1_011349 [[Pythium] brassicae (nom. inval.)]|nr:hypothetical protein PybrP1_011349 [[Pythium] brassicae (nom. inval.)]
MALLSPRRLLFAVVLSIVHTLALARDAADVTPPAAVRTALERIGAMPCAPNATAAATAVFAANALLLDACLADAGYLLFPFAGYFPSAEQSATACASPSCMDLLSGVVLAALPDCDVGKFSPRSLAETLLRVRVDLANARSPPSRDEFRARYELNMAVNRLAANATLLARVGPGFSVAQAAQALNPVEINPDVVLGSDLVIYVQASSSSGGGGTGAAANGTIAAAGPGAAKSPSAGAGSGAAAVATLKPAAVGDDELHDGKLSLSFVFVAFVWVVVNGGYFAVMSVASG